MTMRRSMLTAVTLLVFGWNISEPAYAQSSLSRASAAYTRGDYATAARGLVPLAAAGNARAQAMLGFMCEYGRGVPQDFVIAAMWYTRAAKQGDPTAQAALGLLYDKGRGVPQDAVLAYKWLNLAAAAARGRERDAYILWRDAVVTKMSVAQVDLAQQLASEWAPRRER
jgi:TPR repeat protein